MDNEQFQFGMFFPQSEISDEIFLFNLFKHLSNLWQNDYIEDVSMMDDGQCLIKNNCGKTFMIFYLTFTILFNAEMEGELKNDKL